MKSWKIGFGFLAVLSIFIFFIGEGALLKTISAAQFIVCVVIVVMASQKDRSGSNES